MIGANILWEIDSKMVEKYREVEYAVMKMVQHERKLTRFVYFFYFLTTVLLIDLEKAQKLASLKYCLTHYNCIRIKLNRKLKMVWIKHKE